MNDEPPYIDNYFNGELSTEEKKVFENRCLSDPAFARMVGFYISLQEHSLQQWAERKKQQFAQLEVAAFSADETSFSSSGLLGENERYAEEVEQEDIHIIEEKESRKSQKEAPSVRSLQKVSSGKVEAKVKPMKWWKWLAVAAAVLGVVATGIIWYEQSPKQNITVAINPNKGDSTKSSRASNNPANQNNILVDSTAKKPEAPKKRLDKAKQQQLFARNFVPDAPPDDKDGPLEDAFAYYETGAYKDAITAFEHADLNTVTRESKDELTAFYASYYKALSYMANNNAAKAIPALAKAIKESTDSLSKIKTQWYLSLAYLKTNNVKKTEEILGEVADNTYETAYKTKAAALLNEMKKK